MLTVYTIEQTAAWDALVRTFSNYDVYYLSGYVKAFQLHGDGEPLLFYGEADGVRGINVVMKRDIAADPHFAGQSHIYNEIWNLKNQIYGRENCCHHLKTQSKHQHGLWFHRCRKQQIHVCHLENIRTVLRTGIHSPK